MSRFVLSLLTVCLVGLTVARADDEEPTFLDKKLSHWLELLEKGKDAKTRRRGVIGVEQIGPASRKCLPALVRALGEDKEPEVRKAAARAIGRTIAKTVELAMSKKEDPPRFDTARDTLSSALRTDRVAEVREAAAFAIGDLGAEAKPVLSTLTQALKDKDAKTIRAAAASMRRIGTAAREAQTELQTLLADKKADLEARTDVAIALGQIGADIPQAVPVLKEVLGESAALVALHKASTTKGKEPTAQMREAARLESALRKASADALARLGRDAGDASSNLAAVLVAPETTPELRRAAVNALDQFGSEARAAIPELIRTVGDPALIKIQGEDSRFIRGLAMHSLAQMGKDLDKKRKEAVAAILKATEDPSAELAISAIETLSAMFLDGYGGEQEKVIQRLKNILRQEGRKAIREAAENTLNKIQPKK